MKHEDVRIKLWKNQSEPTQEKEVSDWEGDQGESSESQGERPQKKTNYWPLDVDFWPPELWENKCAKLHILYYFIMATLLP